MRRYRRVESDLNRVIAEMIAERREAGATGDDLLSLLLRAREDGAGMSDEQVRDEALTLFLAGHETTAIALTWTWWLLSWNPEVEARLHAELDATLSGRAPSIEDLPNLPYTQAVVSESIRLRPPAWAIGWTAIGDHRANDVPIGQARSSWSRPGSCTTILVGGPSRRFLRLNAGSPTRPNVPGTRSSRSAGGLRVCIGELFARLEATMLLGAIARRWRFASGSDRVPRSRP